MHDLYVQWQELNVFLEHLPSGRTVSMELVNDYNGLVRQLENITKEDYLQYRLPEDVTSQLTEAFLTKGARLLTRVNERHRLGQRNPVFSGHDRGKAQASPLSINQFNNQEVATTVIVSIVSEVTEQLTRAEANFEPGSKERNFIDQVKNGVKTAKTVGELLTLILTTGQQLGLDLAHLSSIFHH